MRRSIGLIIGVITGLLLITFCSCAPTRPKTNTNAPSIRTADEINRTVRSNVSDSKDAIHRSRTLNQQIEDKLIILRDRKW